MNATETQTPQLPGYELVSRLGAGGYGEVWLAHAPGGLTKAVKFVFGSYNERRAEHAVIAVGRPRVVPDLPDTPDLALEARGASVVLRPERLVVVLPPALRQPEHESSRREPVDHRRLFRDHHLIAVRQLEDRRGEPDALGQRGRPFRGVLTWTEHAHRVVGAHPAVAPEIALLLVQRPQPLHGPQP